MKNILCYGDSNTWGFVPGSFDPTIYYLERFSREQRWTGLLQQLLGADYYIIEAGLNGRTTNVDYQNFPYHNGTTILPCCLHTHAPLDLVILMLGTNDLKAEFNRTSNEITNGIIELIKIIQSSKFGADMRSAPQILLIAPPITFCETAYGITFPDAINKSQALLREYKITSEQHHCHFLNGAAEIQFSQIDGIHLDAEGHKKLAELISHKILTTIV